MDKLPIDVTQSAYAVYGIPGAIGAITIIICIFLIKYFGAKIVDARFNELAKEQDHALTTKIENIRHELGLVTDRATKINQLEYDKLPRIWRRFTEAFLEARSETNRARSYPDVANFKDDKLRSFLEKTAFTREILNTFYRPSVEVAQLQKFTIFEGLLERMPP